MILGPALDNTLPWNDYRENKTQENLVMFAFVVENYPPNLYLGYFNDSAIKRRLVLGGGLQNDIAASCHIKLP
jgi:hypothetical protein